jgi:hypothetical protein
VTFVSPKAEDEAMSTRTRGTGEHAAGGAQVVLGVRPLEVGRSVLGRPTVNLVHSRHYVRNYFDLFRDIFDRIYAAGGVTNTVRIEPGDTVGEALNLTEAAVAAALADETAGESAVLSLIRTIAEDQGTDPADADLVRDIVQLALAQGHPTFAAKADALETGLQGVVDAGTITQAQLDQIVRVFRGVGGIIADALAFELTSTTIRRSTSSSPVPTTRGCPPTRTSSFRSASATTGSRWRSRSTRSRSTRRPISSSTR